MRATASLALLSVLLIAASTTADARSPNIVLIVGDDHGWPYSGFMGDPMVWTPSLDTLAREGMVFNQGQTSAPICRPSLQTLLSGLHPIQWRDKRTALVAERGWIAYREEVVHYRTLPGELRRLGYQSWQGGKHWEGSFRQAEFTAGTALEARNDFFSIDGVSFGRTDWDVTRCGPTGDPTLPCPAMEPLRGFLDGLGGDPFFSSSPRRFPTPPSIPPSSTPSHMHSRVSEAPSWSTTPRSRASTPSSAS